jgi:diacylglycerol O-acyltransferase
MNFEPLEGIDAAFLAFETNASHLHVAAVIVLDPPEGRRSLFSPSTRFVQVRRVIEQRIHLVPQLRQRVARVPLGLHHPVWVDDPDFEIGDHLRRVSLPAPGGSRELDDLVADFVSRPLDPDRPLWEMLFVEGLRGERNAIVAKLHHAILDGVSGASVLAAFLDLGPRDRQISAPEVPWRPAALPGALDLLRYAAGSLVHQPGVAVDTIQRGVEALADLGTRNRVLANEGATPPPAPFSAPRTSINGRISPHRRFATVSVPLEDAQMVRRSFGVTVNDVVLATVSGAVRRLLLSRGEQPDGSLVAMVPVSTRPKDEGLALGNQVSAFLVSLATTFDDPADRLAAIARGTGIAKAQERVTGSRLLADLAQMAPPALSTRIARWSENLGLFDRLPPLFNVVVSNVPGPPMSLFCAGSHVAELYPVGPIADGVGLNITIFSYEGQLHFGVLGCRRLVPEVQDLAIMIDDAYAELSLLTGESRRSAG